MQPSLTTLRLLPCVIVSVPTGGPGEFDTALAIAHRIGRLPLTLVEQKQDGLLALAWQCADGVVEQLAIAGEHLDATALWAEIRSRGLLVSEFQDSVPDPGPLVDMVPVGHWVLDPDGSSGWVPEPS